MTQMTCTLGKVYAAECLGETTIKNKEKQIKGILNLSSKKESVCSCGAESTRIWCPRSLALVWSQPGEAKPRFSSTLSLKQKPKQV